ncbi:MAG: cupin domain-containing protein [Marinicella sp.]
MTYDLNNQAHVVINCNDLTAEMNFFIEHGFKLQQVLPADNPRMVRLAAYGLVLELLQSKLPNNTVLKLPIGLSELSLPSNSPSGVSLMAQELLENAYHLPNVIEFKVNRFNAAESWITGRAGMLYRDLINDRLGGAMIASNIMIPEGGPVADHVHFHNIQFQLICCVKGWVQVVYEDQGDSFILQAGDCVTQPPGIRHQVLAASDGLEVVEIGLPAEHMTTLDYVMQLPTAKQLPKRTFSGQTFCHHQHEKAEWQAWQHHPDMLVCQTDVAAHSQGLASVHMIKAINQQTEALSLLHKDELRFYYVTQGAAQLTDSKGHKQPVQNRDSWVLPPHEEVTLSHIAADFSCIEFVLPKTST